jgi:NADH dehydrogenase
LQQANNLAANLKKDISDWKQFQYTDKGSLAIIGRNKAVLDLPKQKYSIGGFIARVIWVW